MTKILFALFFILMVGVKVSPAVLVEALGEAEISGEDTATARAMAVSRAKWSALEQASGTKVKIDTIMSNAALADEAVKTSLSGTIKSFKITDEGKDGKVYWVSIKADIAPDGARDAFNAMAKNTSVAVYVRSITADGKSEYDSPLARAVEKELVSKGFDVSGVSVGGSYDEALVDKALASGDFTALKSLSYKTLSSAFLLGTIKATSLGNDVGYGKIDFSIVSGSFEWKLVGEKDGKLVVLASGSVQGRGQGATSQAAQTNLSVSMGNNHAIKIVSQIAQIILGENAKTVKLSISGNTGAKEFRELRDDVKNIPFVLNVKELNLKDMAVDYPEKTYYLALFLLKNNKYRIVKMDDAEIVVERR